MGTQLGLEEEEDRKSLQDLSQLNTALEFKVGIPCLHRTRDQFSWCFTHFVTPQVSWIKTSLSPWKQCLKRGTQDSFSFNRIPTEHGRFQSGDPMSG